MSAPYRREFLAAALEAAERAAAILRHYYRSPLAVEIKDDGSPVTNADREAQQAILATLRGRFPGHAFIAEEAGAETSSEFVWTVDPLDGTKNFLRGVPLFSIEIALLQDGLPVLGVSHMPLFNEMLYGLDGGGAFLNGEPVHVSSVERLANAAVSLGGWKYFDRSGYLPAASYLARSAQHVRCFGDAYPYHLVALGRFEAVVEAQFSIWDVAACSAIVRAAGGACTDFCGRPISPQTTHAVCSNGAVHTEVLEALDKAACEYSNR